MIHDELSSKSFDEDFVLSIVLPARHPQFIDMQMARYTRYGNGKQFYLSATKQAIVRDKTANFRRFLVTMACS